MVNEVEIHFTVESAGDREDSEAAKCNGEYVRGQRVARARPVRTPSSEDPNKQSGDPGAGSARAPPQSLVYMLFA